ncbi:MAG: T9SS type A sorting domain-containing protein [Bacteroidales bacterium]|nr:T9SS type A sorting domain-containing protein [Bacteroidales bacterium]
MYKNSVKLSRYAAGMLVLMLVVVLNSAAQYDFMGIRYKGDTVEIPRAKPYKTGKSIPSLDFSIDSIRPLDELVTGNGEVYPWLSLDGNRMYYVEGYELSKIYMAMKKSGEYRYSNPKPLSFTNYNKETFYHGFWLSNDELNIYFVQTFDTAKTFANLYYAKRDSINQQFSEPKKIKLIANNIYNYSSPSFTQDKENLYLTLIQDTNLISDYFLCRFIRTGVDEYTLKDTINIPEEFRPSPGKITSNDLQYFFVLWNYDNDFNIYLFKRDSLKDNFTKLYYLHNSYINELNYPWILSPFYSLTNNILLFTVSKDGKAKKNKLYIVYNLQEINKINYIKQNINKVNIYPNPITEILEIKYLLNDKESISINIYDVIGNKIETIVENELKSRGEYKIKFRSDKLKQGICIMEFRSNKNTEMIKFIKL